jgi:hypothetical protein
MAKTFTTGEQVNTHTLTANEFPSYQPIFAPRCHAMTSNMSSCRKEWQLGTLMRRQSSHFSFIDSLYAETLMDAINGCC